MPECPEWEALVVAVQPDYVDAEIREVSYSCGDATVYVSASNERSTAAKPGEYDVFQYAATIVVRQVDFNAACAFAAVLAKARGTQAAIEALAETLDPPLPVLVPSDTKEQPA